MKKITIHKRIIATIVSKLSLQGKMKKILNLPLFFFIPNYLQQILFPFLIPNKINNKIKNK